MQRSVTNIESIVLQKNPTRRLCGRTMLVHIPEFVLNLISRRAPFTEAFPPFTGGLHKVEYRATYPDYDFVGGGYPALFTKSDVWSYEAEWRLIVEERGFARSAWTVKTDNDFLTLHSGVLKSVTIGCLADESSRQRIEHFVSTNAPGVVVRQATLMPDRYELRINPPFR
jgi:hypothetical protein